MPLSHGKSDKSFKKNVETEMNAGKPQKQSLAIAYALKRKAQKKAMGGQITDNKQNPNMERTRPDMRDHEMDSGFMSHEGAAGEKDNHSAMMEDDRDLNQHGEHEEGPQGSRMAEGGQITDNEQDSSHEEDMVGRIMKMQQKMYSKGGKVSNGGEDKLSQMADSDPNEFDDLALRDDLTSTNSGAADGDSLGNDQEDEDRSDIVARIMRSMMKKDKNPNPA